MQQVPNDDWAFKHYVNDHPRPIGAECYRWCPAPSPYRKPKGNVTYRLVRYPQGVTRWLPPFCLAGCDVNRQVYIKLCSRCHPEWVRQDDAFLDELPSGTGGTET